MAFLFTYLINQFIIITVNLVKSATNDKHLILFRLDF